jgi:hypothetical protein
MNVETKHRQMQLLPQARGLPVAQPSSASHAASEAQFFRQVFPRNAGLQDIQDAAQCGAVIHRPASAAFGRGREYWNQRLQCRPQLITDFSLAIPPGYGFHDLMSRLC